MKESTRRKEKNPTGCILTLPKSTACKLHNIKNNPLSTPKPYQSNLMSTKRMNDTIPTASLQKPNLKSIRSYAVFFLSNKNPKPTKQIWKTSTIP